MKTHSFEFLAELRSPADDGSQILALPTEQEEK